MTTTKVGGQAIWQAAERQVGYVSQVWQALVDARVAVTGTHGEATSPATYVIRTVLGSHVMDVVYAVDEGWSVVTHLHGGHNPPSDKYSGPLTDQVDAAPRWVARMVSARRNVVMGEVGL